MQHPWVVSQEEWLAARKALLLQEKEFTGLRVRVARIEKKRKRKRI